MQKNARSGKAAGGFPLLGKSDVVKTILVYNVISRLSLFGNELQEIFHNAIFLRS